MANILGHSKQDFITGLCTPPFLFSCFLMHLLLSLRYFLVRYVYHIRTEGLHAERLCFQMYAESISINFVSELKECKENYDPFDNTICEHPI